MSIWVDGFTEARINGKWHCIDFHQYDMDGKLCHIPCITGQSFVYHALEWDCNLQDLMGVPDDLSEEVRKKCSADDGVLYGTGDQNWYHWHVLEGSWFNTVNLEVPESCGFFPRNDVCRYLSNPEDNELNSEEMLSIEDYQALEPEVKKAYQYFEYTDPSGTRQIMREFKQAVLERVWAFNRNLSWESHVKEITLSDVRIVIIVS